MDDGYTLDVLAKIQPNHYLVAAAKGSSPSGNSGADPGQNENDGDQRRAIASRMVKSATSDAAREAMESMAAALGLN